MQILCRIHFCCHCCGDGGGFSVVGSVCGCSHERPQRPSGGDFGTDLLRAQHRGERHRYRSGGRLLLLGAPVAMGRRARLHPLLARRRRLLHQRRQGEQRSLRHRRLRVQELNGSFNVRAAGTIEANFPWVEKDTINTCTGKIDSDGRLIVGDYGKEEDRVPTSYAYDSKGNVGHYGGNCIYMYQNNRLVRFDGYMTQNYTARTGAAARTTSSISSPTARTPPGPTRVPASGTS